jgi:hypothetical protein
VYQQGFLNKDRQSIVDAVQFAFRASELISTALQLATFAVFPSIHDETLPPSLPHTHSTLQFLFGLRLRLLTLVYPLYAAKPVKIAALNAYRDVERGLIR